MQRRSRWLREPAHRTGVIREYDLNAKAVRIGIGVIYAVCIVMVIFAVFPIVWVFLAGFKDLKEFLSSTKLLPAYFDLAAYGSTWQQLNITKNYLNSLISVVGCVACALIFNGLLAYGLAILKPRGSGVVKKLVMLSLLMPATISIVPLFMNIQRLHLGGTFVPIWLSFGANAVWTVMFVQFFEALPREMLEASRIDGCSPLQAFFRIVLPLSKPICAVIIIFAINASWSDFLLPYLVLRGTSLETVMVRLYTLSTDQTIQQATLMRSVVFSMIPPIVLFIFFQKQLTENVTTAGIKG